MDQWLLDVLADIEAQLVAEQVDPASVGYARRRRMAFDSRWPARSQLEAHADALAGDSSKADRMSQEMSAIRAAIPREV